MRLAIADPPYPPQFAERRDRPGGKVRVTMRSRARRYYGDGTRPSDERPADHHPDAGEWDDPRRHRLLLEQLHDEFDGWAIATCADGLEHYSPLPLPCRVMAWVCPNAPAGNNRLRNTWEPVIVCAPEGRRGGKGTVPDVLVAAAPRIGFAGAKPHQWTRWVLDALGYDADEDELVDMFPGSGAVASAAAQGVLL